ncbi:MAG: desulfoferrodoxin family protein [Stomatobaculum sp.]
MKFYKCSDCGNIFTFLQNAETHMDRTEELTVNTTDAAQEKHVPVVACSGNKVTVKVGSVAHPMIEAHYIQWIVLETRQGFQTRFLKPEEEPCAEFLVAEGDAPVAAYEYCNLHGLWKAEI